MAVAAAVKLHFPLRPLFWVGEDSMVGLPQSMENFPWNPFLLWNISHGIRSISYPVFLDLGEEGLVVNLEQPGGLALISQGSWCARFLLFL